MSTPDHIGADPALGIGAGQTRRGTPADLAREVLAAEKVRDDTPGILYLDGPTYEVQEAAGAILDAAPALARAVASVADLHETVTVYDECEDAACTETHDYMYDYLVCENSAIGWACAVCCFDGDHPLECRDHHGDHRGVTQAEACATTKALNGANDD